MHGHTVLLILMTISIKSVFSLTKSNVVIDGAVKGAPFKPFWKSTGLCPPDPKEEAYRFLLSSDELINLALIGSLPNRGIKQVRIHWLINLITRSNPEAAYNFTYLDNLIGHLANYNLRPGFELMGGPITFYPDNLTHKSNVNWTDLVRQIANRYLVKYGAREVNKWRFESWNEPDLKSYNLANFTLQEYFNYVDSCREGLKGKGKLGGPAGLFKSRRKHPLCWGLLERCNSLGTVGCPLQYISFHRKGDGTAEGLVNVTLELLDVLTNKFPNLRTLPIANDESDLLKKWSESEEWRGDVRYAANIAKSIAMFYKSVHLDRRWKIELFSYDNAFLNYHPFYFTQRTLFARFQMNNTNPRHSQFIKKPAYSLMGLLSFLRGVLLVKNAQIYHEPCLTVLATKHQPTRSYSVLLSYANGTELGNTNSKNVTLTLNNLPGVGGKYLVYILDNSNTNPYRLWKEYGSPVFPDRFVRQKMRDVEEPFRLIGPEEFKWNISVSIIMSMASVALIHVCTYGDNYRAKPGPVYSLSVFNVTRSEILLTWKYNNSNTPCILTYEVEQSPICPNQRTGFEFRRVNIKDTIFQSYHHAPNGNMSNSCEETRGKYRVRAVDYFQRPGAYSEIVYYP